MSSPANSETDRLDPPTEYLTLENGLRVRLLPLRMRQLFRLLRIVTRGGAQYLPMLREAMAGATSGEDGAQVFGTQLLAVALLALPEAEDEAVDFISSVVEPADLAPGSDKAAIARNEGLRVELGTELFNPDPQDVVTILEAVVGAEKDDLVALGKRLAATWGVATKTGQIQPDQSPPPSPSTEPTQPSSAASPVPSTSSPAPTAGPTRSSSLSPSPA